MLKIEHLPPGRMSRCGDGLIIIGGAVTLSSPPLRIDKTGPDVAVDAARAAEYLIKTRLDFTVNRDFHLAAQAEYRPPLKFKGNILRNDEVSRNLPVSRREA